MRCEHAFNDGAYVLGALSPAERDRYEHHLACCQECRDAVAGLAVLPGLLGRLSAADAERSAAHDAVPDQRLPQLLGRVAAARRQERRRLAAAMLVAVCVAVFAGLAAGSARQPGDQVVRVSPEPMLAMRPVAATSVIAELRINEVPEGTRVTMRCVYSPSDTHTRPYIFRLVAIGPQGVTEQIGSWTAGPGDEILVTGTVRLSPADLTRLEVRGKDGTALLAYDMP